MLSQTPVKDPTPVQRNPLLTIGAVVLVLQFLVAEWDALSALLLSLGVPAETLQFVLTLITLALTIIGTFIGRAFVTPLSNPRNQAGEELTPE